jgi:hypothetical protein
MKACKSENIGVDKFADEKVELKVGADQAGAGSEVDESVAANNGSKFDGDEVVMVETGELKLNPESTKIYGDQIVQSLLKSIEDEGIQTPLKVDRHTKIVLAGNARLRVAMDLGITKSPVIYTNDSDSPLELVATNVAREKTVEAKIREFEIYVPQEKEKTKMRRRSKVPKLEPSKSRDRAAKKVGLSASSLEMGMKVLKVITALEDEKDIEQAETLRETLNNDGINAAHKISIKCDAIKQKAQANGGGAEGEVRCSSRQSRCQ